MSKVFDKVFISGLTALLLLSVCSLSGCSNKAQSQDEEIGDYITGIISSKIEQTASELRSQEEAAKEAVIQIEPLTYPSAWAIGEDWCEDGTRVSILYMGSYPVEYHHAGLPVDPGDPRYLFPELIEHEENNAVVDLDGEQHEMSVRHLMVNLPDFIPSADYNVTYAYAASSDCAGEEIPGLTGAIVDGYENVGEANSYRNGSSFAVPCAFGTFEKLVNIEAMLEERGYKMRVWDCYRPYRASEFISDKFEDAYYDNSNIKKSIGEWSLSWYAADGVSGHNFGTDIDLTITTIDGNFIEMPSHFDAFDETAHLVDSPMNASAITPEKYTEAVKANPACLALHEIFVANGFSEVASEWWHFGDNETKEEMIGIVGADGLDFVIGE